MGTSKKCFILPGGVISLFIVLALATASPWPDDSDGVNFLLGIDSYSIEFHQPHFPGYPVYILAGKLLHIVGLTPEWALVFLSVISAALILFLFFRFASDIFDIRASFLLTMALAVNPVFFEFSHKIFTELFGLALLLTAVITLGSPKEASGKRWLIAGCMFGLLLGVRLSWWPFVLVYLVAGTRYKNLSPIFAGVFAAGLLWLMPLLAVTGLTQFYRTGISFVSGHFAVWGGAISSANGSAERMMAFGNNLFASFGFGEPFWIHLPWIFICSSSIYLAIKNRDSMRPEILLFLTATTIYLAWVLIGQNVDKLRHFIPAIPAIILLSGLTAQKLGKTYWLAIIFLAFAIAGTYTNRAYTSPPAKRMAKWLDARHEPNAILYCGEAERFFDRYPAKITVKNVAHRGLLQEVIDTTWPRADMQMICDDIPGVRLTGDPIATFLKRAGDPVDKTLKIYLIENFVGKW